MPKTWFITGASSGLGLHLTELLLGRGDRVAATARRIASLGGAKEVHGDRLWVESLDVTDTADVRRIIDRAFGELGRIDVVVSNAAYALFGAGEEPDDDQIATQIDTNLTGSIRVLRAALPHLRAQGGGRMLQVSSEGGQVAYPSFGYYHATKWGIEGFVEALAQEVAPLGIGVTIVEPGAVRTNFGAALISAPAMDAYADTPAGTVRRLVESRTFPLPGDARKMAQAMIDSADRDPAPKRLALGSDAYAHIHAALTERLAALEAQRSVALSTDA